MTTHAHGSDVHMAEPRPLPRWRTVVPVTIALALMAAMVLGAAVGLDALVSFGQGMFSRG